MIDDCNLLIKKAQPDASIQTTQRGSESIDLVSRFLITSSLLVFNLQAHQSWNQGLITY